MRIYDHRPFDRDGNLDARKFELSLDNQMQCARRNMESLEGLKRSENDLLFTLNGRGWLNVGRDGNCWTLLDRHGDVAVCRVRRRRNGEQAAYSVIGAAR